MKSNNRIFEGVVILNLSWKPTKRGSLNHYYVRLGKQRRNIDLSYYLTIQHYFKRDILQWLWLLFYRN